MCSPSGMTSFFLLTKGSSMSLICSSVDMISIEPPRDQLHHKLRMGQNGPRLAQSGSVEPSSGLKDKPSTSALSALPRRGE